MLNALKNHWPKYLIEAWCLGTFMVSASAVATALFHSRSPLATLDWGFRNTIMGIAMGLTAVGIIRSPWGVRSGAHFNPAVTLAFWRLGKISTLNAIFYATFQFIGGVIGVAISWALLGPWLADSLVNFVVTVPGKFHALGAFAAEAAMSFGMMMTILSVGQLRRFAGSTPYLAGILLAVYIAVAGPISGTSLNPARTFASALISGNWSGWWIYFTAPPLAMLAAAELFIRVRGLKRFPLPKLGRRVTPRCIRYCEDENQIFAMEPTEKFREMVLEQARPGKQLKDADAMLGVLRGRFEEII
jgi:aquaporin Z